ncbi:prolyl aminopeptidase [Actinoplanes sp. NPDC024001]|uniref:prolyl aminopeptidase n=1 Tax=Actinoplanes sp. NPDC024001 TaxID=3154598 RepID=UPI0033F841F8
MPELDVGDGNVIHWEEHGNPQGKPALVVHGGPGSGSSPAWLRPFDLQRYRVILFDQRGCGRSRPHAADPATDMRFNTTWHLVADMERLREHLRIPAWLLYGGSWGSTLILAYAQQHAHRVTEVVIAAVTMTRRADIDWLYRGVGRFFPAEWERFRSLVPDDDLVGGYARLMESPDPAVREKAALEWCTWEDTFQGASHRPARDRLAFVRICTHYFAHAAWLEEGALLHHAPRLAGIPAVLIHGRLDLGSPLSAAWELHRAWPGSELIVDDSGGHALPGSHIRQALERFAG